MLRTSLLVYFITLCGASAVWAGTSAPQGNAPGATSPTPMATTAALQDKTPIAVFAPPPPLYQLRSGETIRAALARWANDSGFELVWLADFDLPVEVSMTLPSGTTFHDALAVVLKSYWHSNHAITGVMHDNDVLVIQGRMH